MSKSSEETTTGDVQIIETGDSMKVKQVLDEVTIDTITNLGYDIDYSIDNLKLFLMALACGFALYAQFFTKPFPESRFVLGVCFVMYFFLSGVLQAILYFIDKEIILRIKSIKQDSKNNKIKEGTLSSSFPRYQEFYTLTFQLKSNQTTKNNKNDTNEKVVGVMYVGKYFTSKGEFLESVFRSDVKQLAKLYEEGKYSTVNFNHKND